MILFSKSICKVFWTSNRVLYKNKVKFSLTKNATRLFCTEVQCEEKPTIRSMMNKNSPQNNGFAWVLLVIPITAFGLGTWQIKRKFWKEDLIKALKERTTAPVVEIPEDLDQIKDMEYRPVRVRGKFDHSREIQLGPRGRVYRGSLYATKSSPKSDRLGGYLVITPFKLSDRDLTILVNRGWIPLDKKKPQTRLEGQIEGEIELVGLIRHSDKIKYLKGNRNRPELGYWFHRNVEEMAEVLGTAPCLIEADEASTVPGGPIGGQTVVIVRNDHLVYTFTWYCLSALTGFLWYAKYLRPSLI